MRTGIANLPLHGGKTPRWLFERMVRLAREVTTIVVEEFGPEEMLKRLSDPFWFQAFGCSLGFDWHSSGVTTTVCGALKEGLKGREKELGIFVAGGKGATSRKTPEEIENWGNQLSLSFAPDLVYASRMSAKVDNSALQDGYQIYQHSFIFTAAGRWAVVQQGMNEQTAWARRYHWLSTHVSDFVCEPHAAICSNNRGKPLNLVARDSAETRDVSARLVSDNISQTLTDLSKITQLTLPSHHPLYPFDLKPGSLDKILLKAYEAQPRNFENLLALQGVGPKSLRALALVAELIYGAKPSYEDPAKFAFAHGGKDGYPYPVDRQTYDATVDFLRKAVNKARVGNSEKLSALRRLSRF
jgi:hypothetical protein